jgi:hypothetical protein
MALSENSQQYLESLWGERLRELIKERDSKLHQVRQGLMDPSQIYARKGFRNFLQPDLDHVKAIGIARSECWLEAHKLEGQSLSQIDIDEILRDAASNMDCSANALIANKRNEMQSARPIPSCYSDRIPEPSELSSLFAEAQHDAKEQLRRQLTIQMCKSRGREQLASKAQASASSPRVNQTINVHGPNARVNLDSIDNSTNVVRQDAPFLEVRKAVEEGVANGIERAAILKSLADLEHATEKESGAAKYAAFIAAAANHMQLILPFLPLLSHWAGNL